jgi:hypothetical protein
MEILGVLIALAALIAVPFVLAAVALKVLFMLVLLPFKLAIGLVKGVFGLVFGLVGGLVGLAAGGVGLLAGLFILLMVFVLLPLTPLLLLGGLVWLAIKAFSPAPHVA